MRKNVSIAAAAVAFVLPALASGGTAAQPSLRLLKLSPPSVHGTHFRVGEKVGVTLVAGNAKLFRTVRVSGKGDFTVVFGQVTQVDRCGLTAPSLVAIGSLGEKIALKVPQTGCPIAGPASPAPAGTDTTTPPAPGAPYLAPPPPYTR